MKACQDILIHFLVYNIVILIKITNKNIMKKILSKISVLAVIAAILFGGLSVVNAQEIIMDNPMPISAPFMDEMNWGMRNGYGNKFNQDSMLDWKINKLENQLGRNFPAFAAAFAGLGLVFALFALALLAFWIWMVVHAIRHDIDYKPVWILVLWFTNIFGAIVYYFAVKRCCPCCENLEEVCICENGTCVCGKTSSENIKGYDDRGHTHDEE